MTVAFAVFTVLVILIGGVALYLLLRPDDDEQIAEQDNSVVVERGGDYMAYTDEAPSESLTLDLARMLDDIKSGARMYRGTNTLYVSASDFAWLLQLPSSVDATYNIHWDDVERGTERKPDAIIRRGKERVSITVVFTDDVDDSETPFVPIPQQD